METSGLQNDNGTMNNSR